MSRKRLGIDFGTSTIKIFENKKGVILDEKNVIAIYKKKKVLAVGNEAYEMYEKAPEEIRVTYPIKNGVIADIEHMKMMIKRFIDGLNQSKHNLKGADYYLAIPTDITEVETRAYQTLVAESKIKAGRIHLINKPIANFKGLGLEAMQNGTSGTNNVGVGQNAMDKGVMIVDVGANTTEISILSLSGMVVSKMIPVGGSRLDEAITLMVKRRENYIIGFKTAEFVKKEMASAVPIKKTIHVYGRSLETGLPGKITIEAEAVNEAIFSYFIQIADSIKTVMERTPPEIMDGVKNNGIWLTGGSSRIMGLADFLKKEVGIPVQLCKNPENTVILGLGDIMKNPKEFKGEISWEERRR